MSNLHATPAPVRADFPKRAPQGMKMASAVPVKKVQCSQALERIIEASREEFIAAGVAAATIDSIAARANLTRQSVYYYYKNKKEIFYDIVIREASTLVDRFDYLDVDAAAPEEAIRDLLLGLLENADELPILSAFMLEQNGLGDSDDLPSSSKKPAAIFSCIMQQIATRLQVLLDRGAEQGTLRPGVDAARFFAASCMITSGAKNSRHVLKMTCGIDLNTAEGANTWQLFAVDLLMRSIGATK